MILYPALTEALALKSRKQLSSDLQLAMVSSAHSLLWVMAVNTLPCCLHATGCDRRQPETCEESAFLQAGFLHLSEPEVSPPLAPTKCALPGHGAWAMVQIPGIKPYWFAVHARLSHDTVSRRVMRDHNWEDFTAENYGAPGHAVDIGANLGFYSFALAKNGWNVTSFEPMPANRALFKASLCANPDVVERIDFHEHGLGDANQHCYLVANINNIGDGYVSCGNDRNPVASPDGGPYQSRGEFDVKIFDEIENNMFAQHKVDFIKIDVEGYECHVFRGAKKLLAQKPRLIQTEMKWDIAGCTPSEYAQMFLDASYRVKTDAKCQNEARRLPVQPQTWDFWMCLEGA